MTMTLDISDDLKPSEAHELVELAREQERPLGALLLEAARKLAVQRRGNFESSTANCEPQAA